MSHPTRSLRSRIRPHRSAVLVAAVVLALVGVVTALSGADPVYADPLDPENAEPEGARAVARVLADQGVEVDVVRRAAQLEDVEVADDTTLLVTSTGSLGRETAQRFRDRAAQAGAVVVADPSPTLTAVLDLPVGLERPTGDQTEAADCDDPLLADLTARSEFAGALRVDRDAAADTETCFDVSGSSGLVVRVDGDLTTYAVLGDAFLSNDLVEGADNAAVALRLLGQRQRLVWYVPDRRDVAVGDTGSVSAQLPRALAPGLWLLAVATLALLLWRARRLGPLVLEPLPVVVKAIESTQGRGRLYRRTRDRQHASQVLRSSTVRRLATRLRLPADSRAEVLVPAVAHLTGRDPGTVHDLLVDRAVTDDRTLTALAADLAALEKEVHRP